MTHEEQTNSPEILELAESSIAPIGEAILRRSPADWDEDDWTGILQDADHQAELVRSRSFVSFVDLMTILAHHDRHLIDGRDPVRSARASEALALHSQASAGQPSLERGAAKRFEETLGLIFESLGIDGEAVNRGEGHDVPSGLRQVFLEVRSLHATAEVWSSTGPKSDGTIINPLRSIRLENRSGEVIDVDTLSLSCEGSSGWAREGVRVLPGEVKVLEPHELTWNLGVGDAGTREMVFSLGVFGRSRASSLTIDILRRGQWTPDSVPWLVAANIPTADPMIGSLLEAVRDASALSAGADSGVLPAIERLHHHLVARYQCEVDPVYSDGLVDVRTPSTISGSNYLRVSEHGVLLAAAMEKSGLSVFLVHTRQGVRAACGEPAETMHAWTRTPGAIASVLEKLTVFGFDGRPTDVLSIVDLEQAREIIGPDEPDATRPVIPGRISGRIQAASAMVSKWKKELLNLTFTNRQLRMSATSGLRIPLPEDFLPDFVDLLSSGASFEFVQKSDLVGSARGDVTDEIIREGLNRGMLCGIPLSSGFGTRMNQMSTAVRTARAESGMNILHAAVGLLDWVQGDKGKRGLSPLVLVPLQLSGNAKAGYRIALDAGTAATTNTALAEKLALVAGRRIAALDHPPEDEHGLDIAELFRSATAELERLPVEGRIIPEVRLMTANHANAPMWRDLQDNWPAIMDKPIPRHLALGTGTRFIDPVPIRRITPKDEYETQLVSRVDGPQLDAVVNASRGSSFVLEGPPGTGKSQTITNMIAAGVSRGRKILFVAEKKAALDVVLHRLRRAGLSDLVLDVHDTKQSMNSVRSALLRSLQSEGRELPDEIEKRQHRLAEIIDELASYPELLLREGGSESVWSLFRSWTEQMAEFDRDAGWQTEEIDPSMPLDRESVAKLKEAIRDFRSAARNAQHLIESDASIHTNSLTESLERLEQGGLAAVAASLRSGRDTNQLANAIDLAAVRGRLEVKLLQTGLKSASGRHREQVVEEYLKEMSELEQLWREHLSASAIRHRNIESGKTLSVDFIQELARRSGGKVRTLFEEHGEEVLWTTPCVLMSPSGVSKHIPLGSVEFDTVIFDESSQIVPSNAIGALARANSAIFVGDRQQMPPPTEFLSSAEGDLLDELGEETGQSHVGRMKSILTLATSAGLDKKRLTWHYRSRDERLIEFSNRKFYEGSLTTIPTAPFVERTHPIRSVFIGGEYVKIPGSRKGNPEEARLVVAEVEKIVSTDFSKSIMVVTFNSTQRDYIESMLSASDSQLVQKAFERELEPLVVKNVDNVQGDERDVVLFSTVYAPDRKTGNLTQNFGPLNRPGGDNRFNVAVTRARDEIVMFTSLKSADLDLGSSSSKGLKSLKEYLRTAEEGSKSAVTAATDSGDLYRNQVAAALTASGLEVQVGVGTSSFRVDLAVKRPDSQEWVAVLLDNEEWAEQSSVRDRDGFAIGALDHRRGWSDVYRVLVPEWLSNPEKTISEVIALTDKNTVPGAPTGVFGTSSTAVPSGVTETSSGDRPSAEITNSEPLDAARSSSEDSSRRKVVYREAPVETAGRREVLLSAPRNLVARGAVRAEILDILAVQGPTEITVLTRQVARRFGAVKLIKPVTEAVEVSIPGNPTTDPLATIVWPPDVSADSYRDYRVPAEGDPARNFAEIGIREMSNAIVDTLLRTDAFEMFTEEIENEVCGVFGLTTSSKDARQRIREALSYCLRIGEIDRDSQKRYFATVTGAPETVRASSGEALERRERTVVREEVGLSSRELLEDESQRSSNQLIWTEEEMILAADLADDRDWKGPNSSTPEVLELSALLRQAHFHPYDGRPGNFRSPSSVSRKVGNLIGSHPTMAPANSLRTSAREVPIVLRFIEDRASMKALARSIRERILRGEL